MIISTFVLSAFVYINMGPIVFIKSLFYFIPLIFFLIIVVKYNRKFFKNFSISLINFSLIPDMLTKRLNQIILLNLLLIILGYLALASNPTRNLLYLIFVSLSGTFLFLQVFFTNYLKTSYFFFQTILISQF